MQLRVKTVSIWVFFCLLTLSALGQVSAISGAAGIYVYCGKQLPKQGSYVIQRADAGKNNWQALGATRFPADSALFFAQYNEAMALNPSAMPISAPKKRVIWQLLRKSTAVDSLPYYAAQPTFLQAAGIVYYDTTVTRGNKYRYKVTFTAANAQPQVAEDILADSRIEDYRLKTIYAEPYENRIVLRFYSIYNKTPATLKLYRRYYLQSGFTEVPATFSMVADSGRRFFLMTDDNVKKDILYTYYAVPYDVYGNAGISSDTTQIANMVAVNLPSVELLKATSAEQEHAIKLSWKFAPVKFLKGINLYRSDSYDTTAYNLIATLQPNDTVFYDKKVTPIKTYYYFITLVNDRAASAPSARVPGMLKADRSALPPAALTGAAKTGIVQLAWHRPADDTRGYYVYRSVDDSLHMQQVSGFIPVSGKVAEQYTDTLRNRSAINYFYTVKAENTSYKLSNATKAIMINALPAAEANFALSLHVRHSNGFAMLYWPIVAGQYIGVTGYQLFRKPWADSLAAFKPVSTILPFSNNTYQDTTLSPGVAYEYYLQIQKNNGQTSRSAAITYRPPVNKLLSPGGLNVQQNKAGNTFISWDLTAQQNVKAYRLYMAGPGNSKQLLTELPQGKSAFELKGTARQYYAVVCVDNWGNESEIENWVGLR